MAINKPDLTAIAKAVADSPRRDNSVYHEAMAQARQAFADAEAAMGGPVEAKMKIKQRKGRYVVKWVFRPAED